MSEQILNAAIACFARYSIPKTTVDDIAEEMQISRTTFYKYFRGKADVVTELSIRETRKINNLTKGFHSKFDNIRDVIVETVLFAVKEAQKNSIIQHFMGSTSSDMVSEILDRSDEIWNLQTEEWLHLYQAAQDQGKLRAGVSAGDFARWITTIQFVLLTRPLLLGDDAGQQRALLDAFFVPSILAD